jgi:Zn-dependent protease/CBS domain-containing protein
MFGHRWRLFRMLGIPICVDDSWLIILALLTLSLARGFPGLLHQFFPHAANLSPLEYGLMGLVTALGFFGCILLHELGHAVVARGRGMPIRGITLFLFGGVAEIGDEPPSPKCELLVAVAGPAVSLVLSLGFGLLALVGYQAGWPHPFVIVVGYLAAINAIVLAFNLVPAFPLDGGRVLRALIWGATEDLRRATFWASRAGVAFAWFLVLTGFLRWFAGDWIGGIWSVLIGTFLNNASQGSYQHVLVRQALRGERVGRFMDPNPILVPASIDLMQWVEEYVYRFHRGGFPVVADGRLVGYIETPALAEISRLDWPRYPVRDFMDDDLEALTISPDADVLDALGKMQRGRFGHLLVTVGDRLVGVVSLNDLLSFLNLRLDLERKDGPPPKAARSQSLALRTSVPLSSRTP